MNSDVTPNPSMTAPATPLEAGRPGWTRWLILGPLLAFAAACGYGVLEVHSSTDTWIGLACGRQIMESESFPKTDTFSFTAAGKPFFNQNWLTHVWQYWLYKSFGPNSVIYGTWAMAASIFVMTLAAAWLRTRHLLGATVAATFVALGCRDFLSARPATTGFFLMAVLGVVLAALEGPGGRKRWWPIALLLPLMLLWGSAHGSFMFGYGIVGIYLAHWAVMRFVMPALARIETRQVLTIAAVMVAAAIITIATGPFGLSNFTHGEKIATSSLFRSVSEWTPPPIQACVPAEWSIRPLGLFKPMFPPVWRFWWILATCILMFAVALMLYARYPAPSGPLLRRSKTPARNVAADDNRLHTTLFDLFMVGLGLGMTFWARRFGPVFFIYAAPVILVWILMLSRGVPQSVRSWIAIATAFLGGLGSFAIAGETYEKADKELRRDFVDKQQLGLLERVTKYDGSPHESIMFLRDNALECNLLLEWTQGGPVMFFAPSCKLFMDGRAQQVYDEDTYVRYGMMLSRPAEEKSASAYLDGAASNGRPNANPPCDAVLLTKSSKAGPLWMILDRLAGRWVLAHMTDDAGLFLRIGSRPYQQMMERLAAGTEVRADSAFALGTRAHLQMMLKPERPDRAWEDGRRAVELDPKAGDFAYRHMANAANMMGRNDDSRRYIAAERAKIASSTGLNDAEKRRLSSMLDQWQQLLDTKAR